MKTTISFLLFYLCVSSSIAGSSVGNGNRLILATYWGDDKIALIDINGEQGHEEVWSLDTLKAAGCPKPYDIRANKRGDLAYVSCSGGNKIAVVDIVAQQIRYTVETGLSPRDLQLFDDDKRLLVANSGNDTVSVLDTDSHAKLYDVSVSTQPYGVAVAPDGHTAVVTGWASGDLHFLTLGTSSGEDIGKVDVGLLPYTVAIVGSPPMAYVAANASQRVAVVDLESHSVVNQVKVGRNPWSLAASLDGQHILVTNNRSNNLSLLKTGEAISSLENTQQFISAGAQEQLGGVSVKRAAKNASISADGTLGVFTDLANNQIGVIDLRSGAIQKVMNVGKAPYGIEFIR